MDFVIGGAATSEVVVVHAWQVVVNQGKAMNHLDRQRSWEAALHSGPAMRAQAKVKPGANAFARVPAGYSGSLGPSWGA